MFVASSRRTFASLLQPSVSRLGVLAPLRGSSLFSTTSSRPSIPSLSEFCLSGKVFAVTGAGRGLGLVMSEALIDAGAKCVVALDLLDVKDRDPDYNKVKDKASSLGSQLEYCQIDVTDQANVDETFKQIRQTHGRLDGLIAAAGIQQETPALDYTGADFQRMLSVNVVGSFLTARACAKEMIAAGSPGSITIIASMSGSVANRGLSNCAYNASKAAVKQLVKNLAAEWGTHGIRVNSISPGYVETKMTQGLFKTHPQRKVEWSSQSMLGRISMPHEYRGVAVFFASDASSFCTGTDFIIDGGHTSW